MPQERVRANNPRQRPGARHVPKTVGGLVAVMKGIYITFFVPDL
jgi:hypothetical protein